MDFVAGLPKVELHCHLNGCIREETLREFLAEDGVGCESLPPVNSTKSRTLSECFRIFPLIHGAVNCEARFRRLAREMCQDLAGDGVRFAEVRTVPKSSIPGLPSKADYLRVLLDEMSQHGVVYDPRNPPSSFPAGVLTVAMVLSIDRSKPVEDALEVISLAEAEPRVVAVDFAGDPSKGSVREFMPALERVRDNPSLGLTVHIAESNSELGVADTDLALGSLQPDRLGHALLVCDKHLQQIAEAGIHVEVCPTSNRMCLGLDSVLDHPVAHRFLTSGMSISVNTDDFGVFCTSPSKELEEFRRLVAHKVSPQEWASSRAGAEASALGLGMEEGCVLVPQLDAARAAFVDERSRELLAETIRGKALELLGRTGAN